MANMPKKVQPLEMPMAALQAEIGRRLDRQMAAEIESVMAMPSNLMTPSNLATLDTAQMARAMQELHAYRYEKGVMGQRGSTGVTQQPAPQATLEVRDVERLAKAGVTMSFEQIKDRIRPDIDTKQSPFSHGDLIRPLHDRWAKSYPERDTNMFVMSWAGAAFRVGEKVHVMLCTQGGRAVLLEDDYALYPSDALLASLIMMLKTETPTI